MSRISFDEVMNFYPEHNRSVFQMIVEAQKKRILIPFVGAGLSVFCGYKLWGAVLNDLVQYIPADDARRETALEQINTFAYEKAAQTILEAYPYMLDQLPEMVSEDRIVACPTEVLLASASYVLPFLFQNGLAITTNFDRILEKVFLQHNHEALEVLTPNQKEQLAQFRQNDSLGLFKLHGDIGSASIALDDLVFTGEQYDEKYADGSPLVQALNQHFKNNKLLFLGCSLNVDRTMEVLKQVALNEKSIQHFAILGCKKTELSRRMNELKDLRILPIFYDDSDHEAVRVVLERLLEGTDSEGYKKLCSETKAIPVATKEERRLLFDADYFPFTGREKELKALRDFCDSCDNRSWWAVTGPGGMGKSRLVYEFTNLKRKEGWMIERFEASPSKYSSSNRLDALESWTPTVQPTIVVLDDVQAYVEQVMQWLARIVHQPRSEKLRIILLEREGEDLDSSPWLETVSSDNIPKDWCYDKRFLSLEPMADEELRSIMNDFARAAKKSLNAELLLKTLERVDPQLKRPLYAIAIADARCQEKDPTNWDRKTVLDALLDRELDFHFNRFKGLTGRNASKTIKSELKELLARSCVLGFLGFEEADIGQYQKLQKKINEADLDAQEFLKGLGIIRTIQVTSFEVDQSGNVIGEPSEKKVDGISLICPDLIKEHLVLNQLLEDGKMELLMPQGWEDNLNRLIFLRKLLADYNDRLKGKVDFWKHVFDAKPQTLVAAIIYGHIIWGYALFYRGDVKKAVDRLSQLHDSLNNAPEIADYYARGLLILSTEDSSQLKKDACEELQKLNQNYSNRPVISISYTGGLVNLSGVQDLEACIETVAELEKLYQSHLDNSDYLECYVKGLGNLCYKQDLEDRYDTIAKLERLYQKSPDNLELVYCYAKALQYHSFSQDLIGCTKMVNQIRELNDNHPDNSELIEIYADGLYTLSNKQDLKERTQTITQLWELYEKYSAQEGVTIAYVNSLVNFSLCQKSESDVLDTLTHAKKVLDKHPKKTEIQLDYAMIWFNLTLQQCEGDIPATVADIIVFLRTHEAIIPEFKVKLDDYLADHPEHKERYQPFLDLE